MDSAVAACTVAAASVEAAAEVVSTAVAAHTAADTGKGCRLAKKLERPTARAVGRFLFAHNHLVVMLAKRHKRPRFAPCFSLLAS